MILSSSQTNPTTCSLSAQSRGRGKCPPCLTVVMSPGYLMLGKNEFLGSSHSEILDVELCSAFIKYHSSQLLLFTIGFIFHSSLHEWCADTTGVFCWQAVRGQRDAAANETSPKALSRDMVFDGSRARPVLHWDREPFAHSKGNPALTSLQKC